MDYVCGLCFISLFFVVLVVAGVIGMVFQVAKPAKQVEGRMKRDGPGLFGLIFRILFGLLLKR